jgi:cellobiose-specific phosphotransferase system component IIB
MKALKVSNFAAKKKTHVFLLKLSVKVSKYRFWLLEIGLIGPQISACMS